MDMLYLHLTRKEMHYKTDDLLPLSPAWLKRRELEGCSRSKLHFHRWQDEDIYEFLFQNLSGILEGLGHSHNVSLCEVGWGGRMSYAANQRRDLESQWGLLIGATHQRNLGGIPKAKLFSRQEYALCPSYLQLNFGGTRNHASKHYRFPSLKASWGKREN